ncbi:hypothetical protein RhiJN_25519 [Ceratobasidium sp. AG-Ba]|nr:hypothetical protein RhiJN_25519 [Ceratobasidium sp. AG-Ba]
MTLGRALTSLEILRTICQFSDSSDDLKLLYVSRAFFAATIPFIWNNLRGVENLLELIPGVACGSTDEEPEVLNITPSPSSTQIIMWTQLFVSPTLVEISVVPLTPHQQGFLSCLEASALAKHINAVCPNLRFLSLFPDKEEAVEYRNRPCDAQALLYEFWNSSFPRQLESMESLTELCTTTAVLMPIGPARFIRLPDLKNLAIYPTPFTFALEKIAPESPFPALTKFSLNWAPHTLPVDVWRLPIFTNVTSVTLSFVTQPRDGIDGWSSSLVSIICDKSPRLIALYIDFDFEKKYDSVDLSSRPVIKPMQQVPLQTLELVSAHIEESSETGRLIPAIWSYLTVLKLPDNATNIEELALFSELPVLEHLVVELSLSTPPSEQTPVSSEGRNSSFNTLQSSSKVDISGDFYEIAQRLLDMWPKIRHVLWTDSAKTKPKVASQSSSKALAIGLNRTINMLRELSETKLRLSQAYGPDALKMFQ